MRHLVRNCTDGIKKLFEPSLKWRRLDVLARARLGDMSPTTKTFPKRGTMNEGRPKVSILWCRMLGGRSGICDNRGTLLGYAESVRISLPLFVLVPFDPVIWHRPHCSGKLKTRLKKYSAEFAILRQGVPPFEKYQGS